jgi:acid stress-induced BolA-like protein IbaG/YrbA
MFEKLAQQYQRPITVLDLSQAPVIHLEKNDEIDMTYIVANTINEKVDELVKYCKKKNINNILILQKKLSINELKRLGECEHFDIIVAHDFIDLKQINWQNIVYALLTLGDFVFMRVNTHLSTSQLEQFLNNNAKVAENK